MGRRKMDIKDQRFGRLVVTGEKGRTSLVTWLCACECGQSIEAVGSNLRSGNTTSCGCQRDETRKRKGPSMTHSPEYKIWYALKYRLEHFTHASQKRTHPAGVMCQRWQDFTNFIEDMGLRPGPGYGIRRVDPAGDYEPGNCFWRLDEKRAARFESRSIEFAGVSMTLSAWELSLRMPPRSLRERLDRGWPVERALTEGMDRERFVQIIEMRGGRIPEKAA